MIENRGPQACTDYKQCLCIAFKQQTHQQHIKVRTAVWAIRYKILWVYKRVIDSTDNHWVHNVLYTYMIQAATTAAASVISMLYTMQDWFFLQHWNSDSIFPLSTFRKMESFYWDCRNMCFHHMHFLCVRHVKC